MNTELQQNLIEAIEKSLPSLQFSQLKTFFDEFEKQKEVVKDLEEKIKPKDALLLEHRLSLDSARVEIFKLKGQVTTAEKRIKELEKENSDLQTTLNTVELKVEKEKTSMMFDLVNSVLRNPAKISTFNSLNTDVVHNKCIDYQTGKVTSDHSWVQTAPTTSTVKEETI